MMRGTGYGRRRAGVAAWWLVAVSATAWLGGASARAADADPPKAKITPGTLDFGELAPGALVFDVVTVENIGGGTLTVKREELSAPGIDATPLPKGNPTGKTTLVVIRWQIAVDAKGARQEYVRLSTNDPQQPDVKIFLKAQVQPPKVDLDRWTLFFKEGAEPEALKEIKEKIAAVKTTKNDPDLVLERSQDSWQDFKSHLEARSIVEVTIAPPQVLFFKDRYWFRKADILAALDALANEQTLPVSTPLSNAQPGGAGTPAPAGETAPAAARQNAPLLRAVLLFDATKAQLQQQAQAIAGYLQQQAGAWHDRVLIEGRDTNKTEDQRAFAELFRTSADFTKRLTDAQRAQLQQGRIPAEWDFSAVVFNRDSSWVVVGTAQQVLAYLRAVLVETLKSEPGFTAASPNFRSTGQVTPAAPAAAEPPVARADQAAAESGSGFVYALLIAVVVVVAVLVVLNLRQSRAAGAGGVPPGASPATSDTAATGAQQPDHHVV